ncbi:MAG: polysaccharide biosynthesis protein [Selenomonadaceae bacterium]|nr:polysaccharide biosynthesis protein [Selenomonadaceae bacterium]
MNVQIPESFFLTEILLGCILFSATRLTLQFEKMVRKENLKFFILDAVIVAAVPFVTIYALFSAEELSLFLIYINSWVVTITVSTLVIFYLFGIYGRAWNEENWSAFLSIVAAVTISVASAFFMLKILRAPLPKIIFFTQWILEVILISAGRIFYKLNFADKGGSDKVKRVAIVGAGSAGAMLLREIREHAPNMEVTCFVDDDAEKIGSKLDGVPIYGDIVAINRIARKFNIREIIISIPSADGKALRRINEHCRKTDCVIKNVPGIIDFVNNRVSLNEVRKISLEDLLRREPIQMDVEKITQYIVGKIVLITGAGGSIGSELCRQISKVGAHTILLLGRGENSIYEIHRELIEKYPNQNYQALIANVTDVERMREIFETYRPDVVFHAAAHKHVPLMEAQPDEAVRNNVFGTKNVAELADEFKCDMFLLVSTDKAVNPTSVMGATKRVAELVLQNIQRHSKTRFVCTRFGNVLGSRGSVVPLFKKQIANGGPVTVTHPEMIRYFMTIPEAVQLVLQAGSQAEGGEVFLFDMGNPVKIKDMAEDLIKLHGLEPGKDIEIVYTGMRPGEKLYEELLTAEEGTKSTKHKKIFKAKVMNIDPEIMKKELETLWNTRDREKILEVFHELIPTYQGKK